MSRRTRLVLATGIAVVVLVGVAVVAIVRDAGGGGSLPPVRPRPVAPAEGSLTVGVAVLPGSYNPFDPRARTPAGATVLGAVLPQLFDVAPDGSVHGRLVEEGSPRVRGSTATFRLVEGARWSDGRPITAADIAFTLDVVRSDAWPGPDAGYDLLSAVEGTGRDVRFRFAGAPEPGWQRLFSGLDYVLPEHRLRDADLRTVWASGPDVAGGPYTFEGFTPGLDAVLSANAEWWGDPVGVADLRVVAVPDATTLEQLFERSEVDVAQLPAYTERARLAGDSGGRVSRSRPGGLLVSLVLNTDTVPESRRRALLDLVDRDRFVRVLLDDEADVATSWGRLSTRPGWPQWFVDDTGAGQEPRTTLVFAAAQESPMARLVMRSVQRRARSTSLSIDAVRIDDELLTGTWLREGRFDVALAEEVQWPRPCWRCRYASESEGVSNWARVDGLDDLAAAADRGSGEAASNLERRLEERGVVLPLWRPRALVVSRGVRGIQANAWWPGPLYRPEAWSRR